MATTPTTNYSWLKPVPGTEVDTWGPILNTIFDNIDAKVFEMVPKTGATMTGNLRIPSGTAAIPSLQIGDADSGLWSSSAGVLEMASNGVGFAQFGPSSIIYTLTATASFFVRSEGSLSVIVQRTSNDALGAAISLRKQRGTFLGAVVVNQLDTLGNLIAQGYDGAATVTGTSITSVVAAAVPSPTDMESRFTFNLCPAGSVVLTEVMRLQHASGLMMYGPNIVIDNNRHYRPRIYTLATLPAHVAGLFVYVTDLGGGAGILQSDGVGWHRVQDGYETINTDAAATLIVNTNARRIRHTGTLTADRTITLDTTGARAGNWYHITRTGTGAFNLSVGGLKNLVTNTWCEVTFNGTAWYLSAYGAL